MSKHTPGPWKKDGINWFGSDGSKVVVSDGPAFGSKSHFPNAEANARLIAAAPDLLDILNVLVKLHEADVWTAEGWNSSFEEARAAIAKATGENNA